MSSHIEFNTSNSSAPQFDSYSSRSYSTSYGTYERPQPVESGWTPEVSQACDQAQVPGGELVDLLIDVDLESHATPRVEADPDPYSHQGAVEEMVGRA